MIWDKHSAERKDLDQVANKPERKLDEPSIAEGEFSDRSLNSMKENFSFSMMAFLWNKALADLDSSKSQDAMKKDFIIFWKKNMRKVIQSQLESINKALNDGNVDMINIISNENNLADVEDYQEIMNKNITEIEEIFWKMSGKPDRTWNSGDDDDGDDKDKTKH